MQKLTVKKRESGATIRKVLRWVDDEVDLTWRQLLLKVAEAFAIDESTIQLSLDHGKTFIQAEDGVELTALGIVNGDILTLKVTPDTNMEPSIQQTDCDKCTDTTQKSAESTSQEGSMQLMEPGAINRSLTLPMLLRDVTDDNLPANLHQFLKESEGCTPLDQLILSFHVLFLECGFLHASNMSLTLLSQIRLSSNTYKMAYSHVCHEQAKVVIACVPMGNQLAVHAVITPRGNMSLILQTRHFIDNEKLLVSKLAQLSTHVKDSLTTPLILLMKEGLNIDALPPVLDIPHELTLMLFAKLDYKAVCRLGSTCKTLSRVYRDDCLWRKLYVQKYKDRQVLHYHTGITDGSPKYDWYKQFKERTISSRPMPSLRHPPIVFPDIYPFIRPGIHLPPPVRDDPANQGINLPDVYPPIRHSRANIGNTAFRQLQRLI